MEMGLEIKLSLCKGKNLKISLPTEFSLQQSTVLRLEPANPDLVVATIIYSGEGNTLGNIIFIYGVVCVDIAHVFR